MCIKRGATCRERPRKPRACRECKSRKIKCDFRQPCESCIKHHLICSVDSPNTTNSTPRPSAVTEAVAAFLETSDDHEFLQIPEPTLELFDIDPFPWLSSFWDDPLLTSPTQSPPEFNPAIAFDDFDRSRLIHDLDLIPNFFKGKLPPCSQLTDVLRQYFQYVDPLMPVIHVPSFSVKNCPTLTLLLLLAIGDVYSSEQTLEQWARMAFRIMMRKEIEQFENGEIEMSLSSIQVLNMWVSELAYSGDSTLMLLATHCRVTLAHACQKLQQKEEENHTSSFDDESQWINWIKRESRRRTLMSIYLTDTSVSMYLGVAPMLKLSELKVPLPEHKDLWYADSYQTWLQCRSVEPQSTGVYCHEVLSSLMNGNDLISKYSGVVGLHVIAVGLQEMIWMARKMSQVNAQGGHVPNFLMKKSREGLEAWKASWQRGAQGVTRPEYIAVMSAWCCAELTLTAPDTILRMVHRVTISKNLKALTKEFMEEIDGATDGDLMNAAAASIFHVEALSEFSSLDDCIYIMRASVYPNVITSIFVGALCLWHSIRVLQRQSQSSTLLQRLMKATREIKWATTNKDVSINVLLGDLLGKLNVWSTAIPNFC